ncbi:MAG: CoA transferase [Rhodospirillaceae bacterium]|jgi:crotonobetainyl-CoA:carnitine CoA-transferase CaiB-like acyl-CoA transferase|nr:CoA transferase [Rhodospirillaceae bacterium]MBT5667483.1 CoA transferase [Rhodospirillaceae bacterium]MBT5811978.1 CoA transferase [Rhodospirillaceae bacterium]
MEQKDAALPLSGVTVVDFSRLLPGPWATQMLGEFGADVIKVEQPGIGDPSKFNAPNYRKNSVYYNAVNADKRSIAIDMTSADGKAVAERLLRRADVVMESFRPGVAAKLGVDYDTVSAYNARVIYCAISGFGQTGPLSKVAGHDFVIQALSGVLGIGLDQGGEAGNPGFQAADFSGSLYSVIGILAGLQQRQHTDKGVFIDLAMFDTVFHQTPLLLTSAMAMMAGHSGEPRHESFGRNPRYSNYSTKDGKTASVALLEAKAWVEFANYIDRPDLIDENEGPEARHSDHGERGDLYRAALTEFCLAHTRDEIEQVFQDTNIPISPMFTPADTINSIYVKERGLLREYDHPVEGRIPQLVNPLTNSGIGEREHRPAPETGQDTDAILAELGYDESERDRLYDSKAAWRGE